MKYLFNERTIFNEQRFLKSESFQSDIFIQEMSLLVFSVFKLDHDFQHPPASAKEGALWVKDERCGLIADKLVVGM